MRRSMPPGLWSSWVNEMKPDQFNIYTQLKVEPRFAGTWEFVEAHESFNEAQDAILAGKYGSGFQPQPIKPYLFTKTQGSAVISIEIRKE